MQSPAVSVQKSMKLPNRLRIDSVSTAAPSPMAGGLGGWDTPPSPWPLPKGKVFSRSSTPRAAALRIASKSPPPPPCRWRHLRRDQSPLSRAFVSGDVDEVRDALDEDPERATMPLLRYAGDPPLCAAVRQGCGADVAKLLVERGADVHAVDGDGRTPLLVACALKCENVSNLDAIFGDFDFGLEDMREASDTLVNVLLDAGADVQHVDNAGLGAVNLARNAGKANLVRLLLERGAQDTGADMQETLANEGIFRDLLLPVYPPLSASLADSFGASVMPATIEG